MLPAHFVTLESLPLLPSGKVDRRALPAPEAAGQPHTPDLVAPRTPLEEQVADIWAAVLGLPHVSIYDNFFERGGHSLLATQIISRLHERLGIELPLRAFFETPTVAALAEAIVAQELAQADNTLLAQMLDELGQLSPEEIASMLAAE
jgi:surfactin family lipopeptide synthetase C